MSQLILSVPETVTSHYVIMTDRPPGDPCAVVPWRVSGRYRKAAVEALKTPRLAIYTFDAEATMWRLDDLLACETERERIRAATHQVVVVHRAATSEQPHREQTARAVARALADACDGVLIDPQAGHVIFRDGMARHERGWFRMGDQWFGLRYDVDDTAGRPDPGQDAAATQKCACLRITLAGLRRFGLPDLVMDDVACSHDLPAVNVLRALASRLLADQWGRIAPGPHRPRRSLNEHQQLHADDFWDFWGASPFLDGGPPLTVRLKAISRTLLEVGPPDDFQGSRTDWGRQVLVPAMPPLAGCPADEDAPAPQSVHGRA